MHRTDVGSSAKASPILDHHFYIGSSGKLFSIICKLATKNLPPFTVAQAWVVKVGDTKPNGDAEMLRQAVSLLFGILTSFVACGGEASAQSISIFGDGVPIDPTGARTKVTLGVKFWSSQAGTVSAIRFYRARASSSGYVASLYSAGGTLLGSATLKSDSCSVPCWEVADFASPISISANTTYIAAYYSPVGEGAEDPEELKNGVTNGPLTAPAASAVGGNGVYSSKNAFPTSRYEASNFYVDVLFAPTGTTLTLSFSPSNPSIPANAPLGTVVATLTASWSDGSPFTGTLAFAQPYSNDQGVFAISGNDLIINPSGPGVSGDANTAQDVTIVATQ
jgi:hypothetical protein